MRVLIGDGDEIELARSLQHEEGRHLLAEVCHTVRASRTDRPPTLACSEIDLLVGLAQGYPHATFEHKKGVLDVRVAVPADPLCWSHPQFRDPESRPLGIPLHTLGLVIIRSVRRVHCLLFEVLPLDGMSKRWAVTTRRSGRLRPQLGGHSGTSAQANDLPSERKSSLVNLSVWLRIGWLVLAADVVYFGWMVGHTGEPGPEGWWGTLNIFLYYSGALLFVVLLIVSLLVWHANERERTLS